MSYVLLTQAGTVSKYPYSFAQLRADNPDVSFSREPPLSLLAEWRVFPVAQTQQPEPTATENFVEVNPQLVGQNWTQVWTAVPASAEQISERAERAAQGQEFSAAKLDAWIVQFLAMTPAEAQAYINGNSATLAALRTNVARLAYAVRVLARREFNR